MPFMPASLRPRRRLRFSPALLVLAAAVFFGPPTVRAQDYQVQFLVPGSYFHGIHGLAFDRDDQLYAGSVVGQTIYKVEVDSGDVSVRIGAPTGMADDIAFAPDGTMAWTSFLIGTLHARVKEDKNGPGVEVATGLPGINSLAFNKQGRLFASQVFLGDALWEIDISNLKEPDAAKRKPPQPPRKIMENMGGLNGFDFGPDGMLYGPLWFKGQVVKIDVDKGTMKVVADGFKIPAAVNFDSKGQLYVVDTALGQVIRVNVDSGQKTLIASVKTAIDNLAIDSRDRIFITNMADNGVYQVIAETGQVKTVVEGKLAIPSDIAVVSDGKTDTLYVADVFAFRRVDGATGEVKDMARMQADQLEYPFGIFANAKLVVLTSWFTNSVQTIDRATGRTLDMAHDFKAPVDAIALDDGSLLVLELASGELVRVRGPKGKDRATVAKGINGGVAMTLGNATTVYISELGSGSIIAVNLQTGAKTTVATGLKGPEGLDMLPNGLIAVAEVGTERLLSVDPKNGQIKVLVGNLAIGLPPYRGGPPMFVTTGVAVSKSGTIYVSSDKRNAIYKITPIIPPPAPPAAAAAPEPKKQ